MNPTDNDPDRTSARSKRSRRAFLGTTATLGALALAGCTSNGGSGGSSTSTDTSTNTGASTSSTSSMTETSTETTTQQQMSNPDVPILNYALTLEHLEHTFYRGGLKQFSKDELMGADSLSKFGEEVRMEVPDYLETVRDDESAHVQAITKTIESLGGDPVGAAKYDFGYKTPSDFLKVAKALENTGVSAYLGAAPNVVSNDVLGAAAGILSVEARHASFLNLVDETSPFPNAVGKAKSMSEVLDVAAKFVTSKVDASTFAIDQSSRPKADRKTKDSTSDIDVLNYALTLEHLENAFYRDGLRKYSDDDLMNADALSKFDDEFRTKVPDDLKTIGQHEAAHVQAITKTVKKLGGTPVKEAKYDFGYESPSGFLKVAKALENTGVAAYAGAAPTVSNDDVFSAAVGIHSVEARHASFLSELNMESPFPDAVDKPKTTKEVEKIAGQFIVSN